MISKFLSGAALAGLLLAGAANTASAGESSTMAAWKADCGSVISQTMSYPHIAFRNKVYKSGYNVVHAMVDRSGRVLEASLAETSGITAFDRESETFARRLEALPALPDDFADDRALVRMYLVYADNRQALKKLNAKILAAAASGQRTVAAPEGTAYAGLPAIEILGGR